VYEIAFEIISHGDARVDEKQLATFVSAYQSVVPLKLGELWAIPIMIRLALVENLRRVAARIASDRRDRDAATYWSERMIEIAEKDPNNLVIEMADMARMLHDFTPAFVSEFAAGCRGRAPYLHFPCRGLNSAFQRQAAARNSACRWKASRKPQIRCL
jgi:Ser/Thr protein kinase RdoA (MazF antagonist)